MASLWKIPGKRQRDHLLSFYCTYTTWSHDSSTTSDKLISIFQFYVNQVWELNEKYPKLWFVGSDIYSTTTHNFSSYMHLVPINHLTCTNDKNINMLSSYPVIYVLSLNVYSDIIKKNKVWNEVSEIVGAYDEWTV